MRKIPDAELELMMVIWDSEQPVSRMDIETKMENGRNVVRSSLTVRIPILRLMSWAGVIFLWIWMCWSLRRRLPDSLCRLP